MMICNLFFIAVFGAIGCLARYGVTLLGYELLGRGFPWGTMIANILGSFLIGFLIVLIIDKLHLGELWRLALIVGFLGGFTTFSSFSLDVVQLLQEGFWGKSLSYLVLSLFCSLFATALGLYLANKI